MGKLQQMKDGTSFLIVPKAKVLGLHLAKGDRFVCESEGMERIIFTKLAPTAQPKENGEEEAPGNDDNYLASV